MTAIILNLSPDEYHAHEAFSSTVAKTLIAKSPAHARALVGKEPTPAMDRGTIIHRLVLGKGKDYAIVQASDWRTKAAQAQRDAARESGLTPVLAHQFEEYAVAAESIRVQLADRGFVLDGESELAVEWREEGVRCKAMFDHVWRNRGVILDLKITEDAAPTAVERTAENLGYAIQSAAYTRALAALHPEHVGRVQFLFAFCEPHPPYAINICQPDGTFREVGERRWMRAVMTWAECIARDEWPAYGGTNYISTPQWALYREELAQ